MSKTTDKIIEEIEDRLSTLKFESRFETLGRVLEVGDGVVSIFGLGDVGIGEEVIFKNNIRGQVIDFNEDGVWAIVLGDFEQISEGSEVRSSGAVLKIGASESLLGRVVNPLIEPLDGRGPIKSAKFVPIEKIAPGVTARIPVNTPLKTGVKIIDSLIPIGRGQRELIIGDRATGKTSLALDAIMNQKDSPRSAGGAGVISIYVSIGQKQANVAQIFSQLRSLGAMERTIIVAATSAEPPSLQYLAPYVGCSIGEYFMEKGKDVLIIYDDLTKHAWAYRQISLILKKPSGREAYPGDIFYLHARLLERACRLSDKYGGGSLTALPIIETHAGDLSTYIPTNVISITDGQIFLESDLFYAGIRPAVNVGLSVSRVGGAAQTKKIKQVAGPLRLELAQYRELSAFAQFGSDLDKATRDRLERGARITEILKQSQFSPVSEEDLFIILYAVTNGFLDEVPPPRCREFEKQLLEFIKASEKNLLKKLAQSPTLTDDLKINLEKALKKFKETWRV